MARLNARTKGQALDVLSIQVDNPEKERAHENLCIFC